jgi:hypothetical protein
LRYLHQNSHYLRVILVKPYFHIILSWLINYN